MLYAHRFFRTKESAEAFRCKHHGALYSNEPGSRTKQSYQIEAAMAELNEEQRKLHPYCVAWNVVDGGPIKPDKTEAEH